MRINKHHNELKAISSEAISSLSSATSIFANAPAGVKEIWLTVRTAPITMTFDGTTPTAGAVGQDFGTNTTSTPWVFEDMSQAKSLRIKAIQNGGSATAYITYWG